MFKNYIPPKVRTSQLYVLLLLDADSCPTRWVTAYSGTITSPNYPKHYPNGEDCYSLITLPNVTTIMLRLESFQTEDCCDHLSVRF